MGGLIGLVKSYQLSKQKTNFAFHTIKIQLEMALLEATVAVDFVAVVVDIVVDVVVNLVFS